MNQTARREQLASSFFLPIFAAFSLRIVRSLRRRSSQVAVQVRLQPVAPPTRSSPGGKYAPPIHGLQCLGMPGNILGRLSGRESFVQHYSHLHTSHSPRSSSFFSRLRRSFAARSSSALAASCFCASSSSFLSGNGGAAIACNSKSWPSCERMYRTGVAHSCPNSSLKSAFLDSHTAAPTGLPSATAR